MTVQRPSPIGYIDLDGDFWPHSNTHITYAGDVYSVSQVELLLQRIAELEGPQAATPPKDGLVEAVTKAIMFADCGSTEGWEQNTNLGEAAIRVCDARNPPRCSYCHATTSAPAEPPEAP